MKWRYGNNRPDRGENAWKRGWYKPTYENDPGGAWIALAGLAVLVATIILAVLGSR